MGRVKAMKATKRATKIDKNDLSNLSREDVSAMMLGNLFDEYDGLLFCKSMVSCAEAEEPTGEYFLVAKGDSGKKGDDFPLLVIHHHVDVLDWADKAHRIHQNVEERLKQMKQEAERAKVLFKLANKDVFELMFKQRSLYNMLKNTVRLDSDGNEHRLTVDGWVATPTNKPRLKKALPILKSSLGLRYQHAAVDEKGGVVVLDSRKPR